MTHVMLKEDSGQGREIIIRLSEEEYEVLRIALRFFAKRVLPHTRGRRPKIVEEFLNSRPKQFQQGVSQREFLSQKCPN